MKSDPKIKEFVQGQLSAQLTRVFQEARRTANKPGADEIHDLRVSIRRLNTVLPAFGDLIPQSEAQSIRQRLKKVMALTTEVRNRDIAIDFLTTQDVAADHPLRVEVAADRDRASSKLQTHLRTFNRKGYATAWRRALELTPSRAAR